MGPYQVLVPILLCLSHIVNPITRALTRFRFKQDQLPKMFSNSVSHVTTMVLWNIKSEEYLR